MLYLTPPSTPAARDAIDAGRLGMIATPAQGAPVRAGWWWAADNGCFGAGYPGDDGYLSWLGSLPHVERCLFATAPDVVGNHDATVARSRPLLEAIRGLGFPVAFVAQDGMEWSSWDLWDEVDALFIGGSTRFKLSEAARELGYLAAALGKHVHVGRVNSWKRLSYVEQFAHSADGTYLTFAPDANLPTMLGWVDRLVAEPALFPA